MGFASEVYDTYSKEQLREEVDRLARACATQMHHAERDRDALYEMARSVLAGVGQVERARSILGSLNVIAGQTMTIRIGGDTIDKLVAVIDRQEREANS